MDDERGLSFGRKEAPAVATDFANSRAYVIGVNAYSNGIPPLRTAVGDAERLGQLLQESHGYQVRLFPRDGAATIATLRQLLCETMLQEVGPDDRVLFYFAGHGIALDGDDGPEGYLVPEDAKSDDRTSLLAMTELHDSLAKLPCRHMLLILDCCFAGAFRWSSTRDISALPSLIHRERFERYIHDPAWQVLTSAAHDQTALDVLSGNTIGERNEIDAHSPFAAALFRALAGEADLIPRSEDGQPGGDGVITATELYLYLRECVETATVEHRTRQTPGLWPLKKHDKGEYILLTPGHTLNLPPAPLLDENNNPYRGLQSYDEEHAALFFGRSRFVTSLLQRVKVQPLTIVLGASGTGKSSVVKAGLLPHLRSKEPNAWVILPPFRPGKYPLASLASLTLPNECTEPDAIDNRLRHLHSDPDALARRVGEWAAMAAPHARLVIVVDQFEELLTLCGDMGEREQFLRQIDRALTTFPDRVRILLTLRSDFEPQFANSPLQEEWLTARVVVPVMTLDEYREAIEGPASLQVLYLQGRSSSQAFIDRLIGDVANTPGALPLLSFTLSELYRRYLARRGDDRALLEEDYEALGGVGGSLRNRADEVYTGLPDDGHRATMRRVMLRMVSVEGGELARRRVPDEELVYESPEENVRVQEVVRRLTETRLVVEGKETDGQPYIEPAHDELVRGWDKLLGWSREGQESHQLRRLLTPASSDWKQHRGGLWHANPRLNLVRRALSAE
ncbi:MAG: caspase family protein, partial [Planctomycetaceae bacterium]